MKRILVSWIGDKDLLAAGIKVKKEGEREEKLGPIARALQKEQWKAYDMICLLDDRGNGEKYKSWLATSHSVLSDRIEIFSIDLHHEPMNYRRIYTEADGVLKRLKSETEHTCYVFLLSAGTGAMMAIWILLSQTSHPAELLETSEEKGCLFVKLPFAISAEYIPVKPKSLYEAKKRLDSRPKEKRERIDRAFHRIIGRSPALEEAIIFAKSYALSNHTVLILGETGTGKELFAKAIHDASDRYKEKFEARNMAALPDNLIESELFGHVKGAFSSADRDHKGIFENANKGTVFLDEVAELPLPQQAKLLRVLQNREFQPVGSTETKTFKGRIIAATNQNLQELVEIGRFREDLFYRLNVLDLHLPPLRKREGDLTSLITHFLKINNENGKKNDPYAYQEKTISPYAMNVLLNHDWPGNIRELENVMIKLCNKTHYNKIDESDVRKHLTQVNYSLFLEKFVLHGLEKEKKSYDQLEMDFREFCYDYALSKAKGNETKAAELLQYSNRPTLHNHIEKFCPHLLKRIYSN
ncbi:MAG: AAA family ATPase [Candidatus Omnitrophota bacterium]|jgi:transcriptional regulator with GAF, ATPase, and Fis domain|nr:MAG: AAA family ATPase [Candidatus Omnitrophota bacterium]